MKDLTEKQKSALEFVREYRHTHGVSPTVREVATHYGWSSSCSAWRVLEALEKKGFLYRSGGSSHRSWRLADECEPTYAELLAFWNARKGE